MAFKLIEGKKLFDYIVLNVRGNEVIKRYIITLKIINSV